MQGTLSARIEVLPTLNRPQLLAILGENFSNDPPPKLRKELMIALLAYRMQEREFGGLSHTARKRLREIALTLKGDRPSQEKADSAPQTGARLIRLWGGETHEVIALSGTVTNIAGSSTRACPGSREKLPGLGGPDHSFSGFAKHDSGHAHPVRHLHPEQSFNSLDAQREACEAYILSQRHEGWHVVVNRYGDGGFSGGNMERPGLTSPPARRTAKVSLERQQQRILRQHNFRSKAQISR
jgi:Protein of unknown function (DUF2924)